MENEHGYCPNCGADLDGGSVWATGLNFAIDKGLSGEEAEADADRYASMYGATRTSGKWGRAVGLYDYEKDRTMVYVCPDCDYDWPR